MSSSASCRRRQDDARQGQAGSIAVSVRDRLEPVPVARTFRRDDHGFGPEPTVSVAAAAATKGATASRQ